LNGQNKGTLDCLSKDDKKIIRLLIRDLKDCEENSKEKDTIIRDMSIRYSVKDSAHNESKKEINRYKTEFNILNTKYTTEVKKNNRLTNICYGLSILLFLETLLIIQLL
jgi:hypothetical protein